MKYPQPWILCSDFNVTWSDSERSGRGGSVWDMVDFQNLVSNFELIDLLLTSRKFTWSNNRVSLILARLDIFFISSNLDELFSSMLQTSFPNVCFDHCPLILNSNGIPSAPFLFFRFEKHWLSHESFYSFM